MPDNSPRAWRMSKCHFGFMAEPGDFGYEQFGERPETALSPELGRGESMLCNWDIEIDMTFVYISVARKEGSYDPSIAV